MIAQRSGIVIHPDTRPLSQVTRPRPRCLYRQLSTEIPTTDLTQRMRYHRHRASRRAQPTFDRHGDSERTSRDALSHLDDRHMGCASGIFQQPVERVNPHFKLHCGHFFRGGSIVTTRSTSAVSARKINLCRTTRRWCSAGREAPGSPQPPTSTPGSSPSSTRPRIDRLRPTPGHERSSPVRGAARGNRPVRTTERDRDRHAPRTSARPRRRSSPSGRIRGDANNRPSPFGITAIGFRTLFRTVLSGCAAGPVHQFRSYGAGMMQIGKPVRIGIDAFAGRITSGELVIVHSHRDGRLGTFPSHPRPKAEIRRGATAENSPSGGNSPTATTRCHHPHPAAPKPTAGTTSPQQAKRPPKPTRHPAPQSCPENPHRPDPRSARTGRRAERPGPRRPRPPPVMSLSSAAPAARW